MVDLFVALFGGLYYACKIGSEKSKSKAADKEATQRIENMRSDMRRFANKVIDEHLENEVDSFIKSGNVEAIYREVMPILSKIKGYENVTDTMSFIRNVYADRPTIKRALMAPHGKIPYDDAVYWMRSPGVCNEQEIIKWKRNHEFMKWLNSELQKHGVEPMVFVNGKDEYIVRQTRNIHQVNAMSNPVHGLYFWWSGRMRSSAY